MVLWSGFFQFAIVSRRICLPLDLKVFTIIFSCYLSIRPFCYNLSVPIFYSKFFLLILHPDVHFSLGTYSPLIFSFLILEGPVIFFILSYFILFYFCIAKPYPDIF